MIEKNIAEMDRIAAQAGLPSYSELAMALHYAKSGFDLAYNAASKGFSDETLLHCGHHGAKLGKIAEKLPISNS